MAAAILFMAESLSSDDCEVEDPKLGTSVESQQDRGTTTTADSSDIKCTGVEYPQPSDGRIPRPKQRIIIMDYFRKETM